MAPWRDTAARASGAGRRRPRPLRVVKPAFEDRDVTAMLNAFFDTKVRLAQIGDDVRTIRLILEDGDEGEEEEAEEDRSPDD